MKIALCYKPVEDQYYRTLAFYHKLKALCIENDVEIIEKQIEDDGTVWFNKEELK